MGTIACTLVSGNSMGVLFLTFFIALGGLPQDRQIAVCQRVGQRGLRVMIREGIAQSSLAVPVIPKNGG
jgi:hypothetical protein